MAKATGKAARRRVSGRHPIHSCKIRVAGTLYCVQSRATFRTSTGASVLAIFRLQGRHILLGHEATVCCAEGRALCALSLQCAQDVPCWCHTGSKADGRQCVQQSLLGEGESLSCTGYHSTSGTFMMLECHYRIFIHHSPAVGGVRRQSVCSLA